MGDQFDLGQPFGTVESVKSVSEVYTPMTGVIAAINGDLDTEPEEINADPYGTGAAMDLASALLPMPITSHRIAFGFVKPSIRPEL